MAALTVEFPQVVWSIEFGGDETVVRQVTMTGGGVTVHNDLTGRSDPDTHPISSITGLSAALAAAGNVDSVNGQTGTVSLDLDDLTDVDTTTDPPDADDVLAWDGTLWTPAALTAADTGAIPASLIDAKGDLIVGTANDTAARLGVGSNGQVLTADSAQVGGVKWAAAAAGGGQRARGLTSTYWVGSSAPAGATTPTANQMDLHTVGNASCWPVWLAAGTYDRIAVYVGTAGTATLRLGLSYSAADGGVGAPAWDAGTINVASPGRTEITGSVTLVEGWYWTVVMTESYTATFNLYGRSWTQNDIRNGIALEPNSFRQYSSVRHAGIPTGSLPDLSSYPAYGSLYGPIVALRRA